MILSLYFTLNDSNGFASQNGSVLPALAVLADFAEYVQFVDVDDQWNRNVR